MNESTPSTEATDAERPQTFTAWLRQSGAGIVSGMARGLIAVRIGPDVLTLMGLVLAIVAGILAAQGRFVWAGVVYLLGVPFDALDGAVARQSGKASRFGALLDSTLDRYGEAALLGGLAYYYAVQNQPVSILAIFAALFGSVMVSYTRARSEGLLIDNKVGLLTRVERFILTVIVLLIGRPMIGVWLLAGLTQVTVVQRLWHVYRTIGRS
ncbi:MAG: CDP-alcohol phosphatidyltransferase family protein [Anaerolineae bacterium]|nr:CDP-alcohol phosphatidyltransferase family protein [Anaerolineae bacterium]